MIEHRESTVKRETNANLRCLRNGDQLPQEVKNCDVQASTQRPQAQHRAENDQQGQQHMQAGRGVTRMVRFAAIRMAAPINRWTSPTYGVGDLVSIQSKTGKPHGMTRQARRI